MNLPVPTFPLLAKTTTAPIPGRFSVERLRVLRGMGISKRRVLKWQKFNKQTCADGANSRQHTTTNINFCCSHNEGLGQKVKWLQLCYCMFMYVTMSAYTDRRKLSFFQIEGITDAAHAHQAMQSPTGLDLAYYIHFTAGTESITLRRIMGDDSDSWTT